VDRPPAFRLTAGNIADITVAAPLLQELAPSVWPIGDKGYDADHLRALLDSRGTIAVPATTNSPATSSLACASSPHCSIGAIEATP
jgi:hypothetical protein